MTSGFYNPIFAALGMADHSHHDHGAGHTMQGIPTWMAIGGVVIMILPLT